MASMIDKLVAVNSVVYGEFSMKVIAEDESFVSGTITSDSKVYNVTGGRAGKGDQITVKKSDCKIDILPEKTKPVKKKKEDK